MIPHTIQIKNFLSYGPQLQTINFANYDLICLSGKNGHGKSALLDAMTWALWGQARKVLGTAKPDAGLLRLGQTQMLVIFDFELSEKRYRIRREYMETYGKPLSVLEFGIINTETQEFIALTDKTIRTTQAKIEQIVRLDFDSFSNSAFLRQGNSNEFSKKSPKDRKQILAAILGLDQYEQIRKKALDKIKDATFKKNVLVLLQEKRVQELASQEQLTTDLAILEQEMTAVTNAEKEWNNAQTIIEQHKTTLEQQQKQYALTAYHSTQLIEKQRNIQTRLLAVRNEWKVVHRKKQSFHASDTLEQEKKKILTDISQQQKLFQLSLEKKEALLSVNQQLAATEQHYKDEQAQKNQLFLIELERLKTEQKNNINITKMLRDELQKYTLEQKNITAEIALLNTQLATLKQPSLTIITAAEKRLEKRKTQYQHFVSLGNWMSSELQALTQKKKLVHDENNPSCPLCEQNLSASRRRFIKSHFDATESFLTHRLQRLKRIIPLTKQALVNEHAHLVRQKEDSELAEKTGVKITELLTQTEKSVLASNEIEEKLRVLEQETIKHATLIQEQQSKNIVADIEQELAKDNLYAVLFKQRIVLESAIKELSYNPEQYAQQQARLTEIEQLIAEHESLKQEISQQDTRKQEIHTLCCNLKTVKTEQEAAQKTLQSFGDLSGAITAVQQQEEQQKQMRKEITTKKDLLLQTKGSIENQQKHLAKVKRDHAQEIKNIAKFDTIIDDYQAISTATGKDGIQALLIEEAIPEIEQEANQLLSQLTNNQAQVFIESLRDLKKGGTKETLDIKISDQNGIRPYEMFSGGEAFRIDFALRIALSKILARRAGTALQTLIIDEGFGSQDEDGLSHIMDALHTIRDNFSKIIVVSHLASMKDQFPVQFVVHKGVQGSVVSIIEQG